MSALKVVYWLQGRVERSAALIQWIVRTCQPLECVKIVLSLYADDTCLYLSNDGHGKR